MTAEWRKELIKSNEAEIKSHLDAICNMPGVIETGVFGSYAKNTCTPKSDVDVYVIYDPSLVKRRDLKMQINYLDFSLETSLDFQIYYIEGAFGPVSTKVTEGRIRYDKNLFRLCR